MGAVDDWSGAVLLPSLYQSLDSKPRRHRFVFVGFAGEEAGLHGSGAYVNKLTSDERSSLRAMVNLECLGLSPPKAWASRADPLLLQAYVIIASSLHLEPSRLRKNWIQSAVGPVIRSKNVESRVFVSV
jgi:Zn-dependent M28 family amino/carboxypeptidase